MILFLIKQGNSSSYTQKIKYDYMIHSIDTCILVFSL